MKNWSMRSLALLLLALAVGSGCSNDDSSNNGAGDAAADVREVVEVDAAEDATQDSEEDTTDDVAEDSEDDAVEDTSDTADDAGDTSDTSDTEDVTGDTVDTSDTSSDEDGDTCDVAIDITSGGVFDNQTTVGLADDYEASPTADGCPAGRASGPDIAYVVNPSVETTYVFTVHPQESTFDPFIYLKEDCSADACLDGTVLNGPGVQESIEYTVGADETVYVIVDGELGSEGAFNLSVGTQ